MFNTLRLCTLIPQSLPASLPQNPRVYLPHGLKTPSRLLPPLFLSSAPLSRAEWWHFKESDQQSLNNLICDPQYFCQWCKALPWPMVLWKAQNTSDYGAAFMPGNSFPLESMPVLSASYCDVYISCWLLQCLLLNTAMLVELGFLVLMPSCQMYIIEFLMYLEFSLGSRTYANRYLCLSWCSNLFAAHVQTGDCWQKIWRKPWQALVLRR